MASAAGPQNSGNVNYFFHIIVFLCITFLFGKLDPIAPLTPFGMNTIGVFLGVIYAWVFIDIIWPSMVGLLALMLLDVLPATALLNKGFGDPTVIMMMFIFFLPITLSFDFLYPTSRSSNSIPIKLFSIDDFIQIYITIIAFKDFCLRLDSTNDLFQFLQFLWFNLSSLIQKDNITELNLLNNQ